MLKSTKKFIVHLRVRMIVLSKCIIANTIHFCCPRSLLAVRVGDYFMGENGNAKTKFGEMGLRKSVPHQTLFFQNVRFNS